VSDNTIDLGALQNRLAELPETHPGAQIEAGGADFLSVAGEFSKLLRKIGIQQTRAGTDLLAGVREATSRLDEVHQAALDSRDRAVQAERQAEKLALTLIGQLDLVVRAIGVMREAEGVDRWADALEKGVLQTLTDASKWGLSGIGNEGEEFDPDVHDSVNQIDRTEQKVIVSKMHRKGYSLNGRLLRRAEVEIAEEA